MKIYILDSFGDTRYFLNRENAEKALVQEIENDAEDNARFKELGMKPVEANISEEETED